jgi:predicted TPR repeat methyltransferase
VLHFIPDLEAIFAESGRILKTGGVFAFTTKVSNTRLPLSEKYGRQAAGEFEIFSHTTEYLCSLLMQQSFKRLKAQKCFVGEDVFSLWVFKKINH